MSDSNWKRNLYILMVCQFFVMSAMTMIIPFLPLYLQDLGVTDPQAVSRWSGIIFGANFLTAFLFSPLWGRLADQHGRKMMLLRSGFGMAVVLTLTGFATGPWSLLFLRLLNGMISGFIPAAIALISMSTPKKHVGYSLGLLQAGAVAGGICGPLLGGVMADVMGFRMIFYVTGFSILIAGLVVLFFVKENFEHKAERVKTNTLQDFKKIASTSPILALFAVFFIVQCALVGINPLLSLFVQELTPSQNIAFFAGLAMSVMGFANMSASPFLGRMSDRKGQHVVLLGALLFAAIVTLPQAFVQNYWQLISFRFLLGLGLGGLLPSINSLIRLLAPEGMESRTYGFSNSFMYLGTMIGPIAGGWLTSVAGIRSLFIVSSLLLFINVLIVKYRVVPEMKKRMKKKHALEKTAG
ncbi:MFS transporter, DHA1 family, multidrug resistance protein [Evansella caseinilytica]|uniref:MFS transporter, DHA1 family, multidrug resistance protein n=1 Tax=Evansella caseinilytica TaxID=1503961 RepID=A0A1H3HY91_9BACI|nr:MFS transporter [Evansella caseinilytica]SDY20352.1 MFS transporter, DHA1 family, multidrug resistance protein [Evansella caseinilytica]